MRAAPMASGASGPADPDSAITVRKMNVPTSSVTSFAQSVTAGNPKAQQVWTLRAMVRPGDAFCVQKRAGFGWLTLCRRDDSPHQVKLGLINVGRLHRHRQRADLGVKVISRASL